MKNDDATVTNFYKYSHDFDLLHIASHGKVNRRYPLYSYINFYDRKLNLYELMKLKLKSRLVVLSACETGLSAGESGIIPGGHDIVSFPRAFISSGVGSVIAPLWIVEDESTLRLMTYFYQRLSEMNKREIPNKFAEAVTLAQRDFLNNARSTGINNHPFYWAAFFITGCE